MWIYRLWKIDRESMKQMHTCNDFCIIIMWILIYRNEFFKNFLVFSEIYRRVYNSATICSNLYISTSISVSINKMIFNILEKHDCFIFFFEI